MRATLHAALTVTLGVAFVIFAFMPAAAQSEDTTFHSATLDAIIDFALAHQPVVKQAEISEEVVNKEIRGKLADWYPQINFTYNYQRFLRLQSSVIGGNVIRFGVNNTSSAQFTGSQILFNRDVLLASSTASQVRNLAGLNTNRTKIDLVVDVSKAFYDVLATTQQIRVTGESIARLTQSEKDAYSRYEAGVADKTDYKRATIQLNNARASLKSNREILGFKLLYLKNLMGYPANEHLQVQFDPEEMEQELPMDTLQHPDYISNIDYHIRYAQRELQEANVRYSYWGLLPTLSAFGAYNLNYQNNNLAELYNQLYPYSYVGLTLAFPIFQGGKRITEIQRQKLICARMDSELKSLRMAIDNVYEQALTSYKSNVANYQAQKENVEMAQEVYEIIQLQYENGVRTYLDVTMAESDLRTTRLNYYNALYEVLSSKMDVLRARGEIQY